MNEACTTGAAAAAVAAWALATACAGGAAATPWPVPEVSLPNDANHPVVACTAEELARLRAAWKAAGRAHAVVAAEVRRADEALQGPVTFPPRGGQHNQWYQCAPCEMGLRTVDPTHHKCPKCRKIYTGEPYDDVIFEHVHEQNLRRMASAAWAWAVTGEKRYAEFAGRVLLGYAERYRTYPYHDSSRRVGAKASRSGGHLFEQTLNEAVAMSSRIAPAYDLVHDALTGEQRKAIRDGLILPMLESIARNQAGKSNWQTWHNAGMLWGGAAIGEVEWVRRAIADPKNGFAYQMGISVSDEGMWYENSWGYHFYTLSAMMQIVEGARRLGIDLWGHPTLRKMFTLPIRCAMADGSLPRFGDDVQTTVARISHYAEPAWHACRMAALAALLPKGPTWESILLGRDAGAAPPAPSVTGSEVFRGAGHAILRTSGPAGLTAAVTFGPYGGFHGHFDKLSFVFFGHGRELGVDPGRARSQAYRLPIHRNWYKATVGHNAVLVDGASQEPAEGTLEGFAASERYAGVVARCDAAYAGVRHRRVLLLTPTYLLVLDDLAADREREFAWVYHNRGTGVRCDEAGKPGAAPDKASPWWGYLQNARAGATSDAVRVAFADQAVTTHLTAAGGDRTDILTADGPAASVLERVSLVMLRRRAKAVRFACVLEPVAGGVKPGVSAVGVEQAEGEFRVVVHTGAGRDTVTLSDRGTFSLARQGQVVLQSPASPSAR